MLKVLQKICTTPEYIKCYLCQENVKEKHWINGSHRWIEETLSPSPQLLSGSLKYKFAGFSAWKNIRHGSKHFWSIQLYVVQSAKENFDCGLIRFKLYFRVTPKLQDSSREPFLCVTQTFQRAKLTEVREKIAKETGLFIDQRLIDFIWAWYFLQI